MPLDPGTLIGPYEIRGLLGAGGMGEVYLAWDPRLGREVALKRMSASGSDDPEWRGRFLSEARLAAGLKHPGIVAIHDILWEGSAPYIVMERLEGETLRERIQRGPIPETEARPLWLKTVQALAAAHAQGLVHRDLKPENLFITLEGDPKILDFGLAKRLDGITGDATQALETGAGAILGTLTYLSPEQARGEPATKRSDVHALGLILLEMLTGRAVFRRDTTAETLAAVLKEDPLEGAVLPAWASALLRPTLVKDPSRRPPDAAALLDPQVPALAPGTAPPHRRWRGAAWIGTAVAAILLGLWVWRRPGPGAPSSRPREASKPARRPANPQAYEAYLRGRVLVDSENREDLEAAIKLLEQATSQDPDFAPAYAELARAYSKKAFYFAPGVEGGQLDVDAEVAIERALALDPDLAEAHAARGLHLWTHAKRFPHEQAIKSLKRAIALNPRLDDAHHHLGVIYFHIGLFDQAQAEVEKALDLKPDNTLARFRIGVVHYYRTRYEEALVVFKSTPPGINPSIVGNNLARTLLHLGKTEEASAVVDNHLRLYPKDEGGVMTSLKAVLLAKAGRVRDAEAAIRRSTEIGRDFGHFHHTAYNIACAYALMNRPEEALKWLQDAADDGFPCYPYFEKDAWLDNLRQDARFIAFMERQRKQWEGWKKAL